VGLLWIS